MKVETPNPKPDKTEVPLLTYSSEFAFVMNRPAESVEEQEQFWTALKFLPWES
jgi:hypothetical protein